MRNDVVIFAESVSKKFCRNLKRSLWYGVKDVASEFIGHYESETLRREEFWALRDISFELKRGQCVGLIGGNGAGKTTLLKMLNGLIKPDKGQIALRGRVGGLIALGAGFNQLLTGRENIYINGAVLGLSKHEITAKFDEIVNFAEVSDFVDMPVRSYSSGMAVRLGFSIATALEPDILLVDEVLAVGDFRFRWKCFERIKQLMNSGVCIVIVSHNSRDLMRTCSEGLVLQAGETVFFGGIDQALLEYEHSPNEGDSHNEEEQQRERAKVHVDNIVFRVDGKTSNQMKSRQGLSVRVELQSRRPIDKSRIVLGLHHADLGHVFSASSFAEMGWIPLPKGSTIIDVDLGKLPLQYGKYFVQVSIRGQKLDEFHSPMETSHLLFVDGPRPDYEGFGLNGIMLPEIVWQCSVQSDERGKPKEAVKTR